jgi:hypothetical protein
MKRYLITYIICLAALLICTFPDSAQADSDSADVAITSTSAYPGHFAKVEMLLKSPVPIAAFQLHITISNPDLVNFHTDSTGVETTIVPIDTCTGPLPHGDSCWVDSLDVLSMRYCYIDTVGTLLSNFGFIYCHGDTGDLTLPDCKRIKIIGFAALGDPIPADTGYEVLLRFGVDALCVADTLSDRDVTFYVFPSGDSYLSDPQGDLVPFRYHPGELSVLLSVPGDASNDSLADISDVVFLLNYLFKEGPGPCVPEAGDANGDGMIDVRDVIYMLNYLFKGGPPPYGQ